MTKLITTIKLDGDYTVNGFFFDQKYISSHGIEIKPTSYGVLLIPDHGESEWYLCYSSGQDGSTVWAVTWVACDGTLRRELGRCDSTGIALTNAFNGALAKITENWPLENRFSA